jgi:hypothetical protein
LATPFLVPACLADEDKVIYNQTHCGSRSIVENVNGILKKRHTVLDHGLPYYPDLAKSAKIIQVKIDKYQKIHNTGSLTLKLIK